MVTEKQHKIMMQTLPSIIDEIEESIRQSKEAAAESKRAAAESREAAVEAKAAGEKAAIAAEEAAKEAIVEVENRFQLALAALTAEVSKVRKIAEEALQTARESFAFGRLLDKAAAAERNAGTEARNKVMAEWK